MQVVIEIATYKPLARFLAATCTPTYTRLPERAQNDFPLINEQYSLFGQNPLI